MNFRNFQDLNTAWEAAEQQRLAGDFLAAYESYLQILMALIAQSLPQWAESAVATIIQATADLTVAMGDFERADRLFENLIYLYESAENYPLAHFTVFKRIHLALERGHLDRSQTLLNTLSPQIGNIENIDISRAGLIQWEEGCFWNGADTEDRSILFAQLYFAMGKLLSALGQYGDALLILERGLWHTGAETPALARQLALPLHFSIAAAYLEQGKLVQAWGKLTDLQTTFDPNLRPELEIYWLELMGKISLLRGELGQALQKLERVQIICRDLGLTRAVLQSTLNLANVLIFLNQTSLARDYLLGALSEPLAQQNAELKLRLELLLQLADARGQSLVSDISGGSSVSEMRSPSINRSNHSIFNELENLKFSFDSANYLALFEYRVLQFYWLLSCFDLDLANQLLTGIQSAFEYRTEPIRQGSDSQLIQVKIKILVGTLAYYQGVVSKQRDRIIWAASNLDKVRPELEQMGLKPELWQVKRILCWCWSRLKIFTFYENIIPSTNQLLAELTESLSPEDRAIFLLNKWTADEEYIAGEINNIQRLDKPNSIVFKYWRHLQSLNRLNRLISHIDRYKDALAKRTLQHQNPSLDRLPIDPIWKRVLNHPRDRITLMFLVLPDRILVVRIGWLLLDYRVISKTRLELRNLIQSWHTRVQGFNRDLVGSDTELEDLEQDIEQENCIISSQISEIIKIDSLLKGLPKRIKNISIVPDDILHGFPFATILYKGKYLIENYAISIAYESKYVDRAKSLSPDRSRSLLVGVSQGHNPLPNVPFEIAQVQEWMQTHRLNPYSLMNDRADKKTVLRELSNATLFHVACHGTFEHNQPDLSGLVLSYKPEKSEILSLRELSALDLSKLRHATLSACWSADHFVLPGRWIISLPETLWRSGTGSILGCLWQVDDIVAVPFMNRFYQHLEKQPRDKALRLTQQECLAGKLPITSKEFSGNLRNPLYWSGFTLYGDYKKLDMYS